MIISLALADHHCQHDFIEKNTFFVTGIKSAVPEHGRHLINEASTSLIRINLDDNSRKELVATKKTWLNTKLVPAAIAWYSTWLKVIPVVGNIKIKNEDLTNPKYCNTVKLPLSHQTTGVAGADYILYLTTVSDPTSKTIATGLHCGLDFDGAMRPIAGTLTFTEELIDMNIKSWEEMFATTIHEMAHMLGFSDSLFQYYKNDAGAALNPVT
jgi:hypothetical protein